MIITTTGCHSRQEPKVDITPHHINLQADSFYQQAMTLMESSYDVDSTRKCIRFLDKSFGNRQSKSRLLWHKSQAFI